LTEIQNKQVFPKYYDIIHTECKKIKRGAIKLSLEIGFLKIFAIISISIPFRNIFKVMTYTFYNILYYLTLFFLYYSNFNVSGVP